MRSSPKIISDYLFKKDRPSSESKNEMVSGQEISPSPVKFPEMPILLQRIEELGKGVGKDEAGTEKAMDKTLIFAQLYKVLNAGLPDAECGLLEIPKWKKEQMMTAWLAICEINQIKNPLSVLMQQRSYVFGKATKSIQCIEKIFGEDLVKAAIENEKSGYNSIKHEFNVHDAVLQAEVQKLQKIVLKNELKNTRLDYMGGTVIPAVMSCFAEEKSAKNKLAEKFVIAIQKFFEDPANAGGILGRSLNGWPSPKELADIANNHETDLKNMTNITVYFLNKYGCSETLSPEEKLYLSTQSMNELNGTWKPMLDQLSISLFDEMLNPKTGKMRDDMLEMFLQIQNHLPADSAGRQYDLYDEENQQALVHGLIATLYTNIYFGELNNAPTKVIEMLAQTDPDKLQIFAETINSASAKILNTYNNILVPVLPEHRQAFTFLYNTWERTHGISEASVPSPRMS